MEKSISTTLVVVILKITSSFPFFILSNVLMSQPSSFLGKKLGESCSFHQECRVYESASFCHRNKSICQSCSEFSEQPLSTSGKLDDDHHHVNSNITFNIFPCQANGELVLMMNDLVVMCSTPKKFNFLYQEQRKPHQPRTTPTLPSYLS